MRRLAVAASAIAVLAAVTGCSNDDDSGSWTRVETDRLSVDRPADWDTSVPTEDPWTDGYAPRRHGLDQLQLTDDYPVGGSADAVADNLNGRAVGPPIGGGGLDGFRIESQRTVDIDGATDAKIVDFSIADGHDKRVRGAWIIAVRYPSEAHSAIVSLLMRDYDPAVEKHIAASMDFHP